MSTNTNNGPSKNGIDYLAMLNFVGEYGGIEYNTPENAAKDQKELMQKIQDAGKNTITPQLNKIKNLFKGKYGFHEEDNSWQHGDGKAYTNDYIWIELRYPQSKFMSNPISISVFLEKAGEPKEIRCRFCLEINKNAAKKLANSQKEEDKLEKLNQEKEKYHKFIDIAYEKNEDNEYKYKKDELIFLGNEGNKEYSFTTDSPDDIQKQIKEAIEKGEYEWLQIGNKILVDDNCTNQDIENEMFRVVEALIPYYEHVIDKDVMDKSENDININTILYGPPGTGKTYNTVKYAVAICNAGVNDTPNLMDKLNNTKISDTDYDTLKEEYDKLKENGRIVFTTFHQSYGYEEFIEGIKPMLNDTSSNRRAKKDIQYKIEDGVFKKLCDEAGKEENKDKNYVLIIDEINRGNISKIFGELITLIEGTKRAGMDEAASVTLPYSKQPFSVPKNVYIIGTMNTADRSIALMDTALRRRFNFVEMMPNPELDVLKDIKTIKTLDGKEVELDVSKMLSTINKRIEYLVDREHTIGHAFFTSLKKDNSIENLAGIFRKNIIPLLQEYFYEDYTSIILVLGDNAKDKQFRFITEEELSSSIFRTAQGKDKSITSYDISGKPVYSYKVETINFYNIQSYIEIYSKSKDDTGSKNN